MCHMYLCFLAVAWCTTGPIFRKSEGALEADTPQVVVRVRMRVVEEDWH